MLMMGNTLCGLVWYVRPSRLQPRRSPERTSHKGFPGLKITPSYAALGGISVFKVHH